MSAILSQLNSHYRDEQIRFYASGHKYEILSDIGSKYVSVTTWNHGHFPKFDADAIIRNIMSGKNWNETNKYWGMTSSQIKASWKKSGDSASCSGTNLHERIENFMNNDKLEEKYTNRDLIEKYEEKKSDNLEVYVEEKEWVYFLDFVRSNPLLKPYRTEWMIYDEDIKIAGSIDMVYENDDGTLSIYDWKRCKEISSENPFRKFASNPLISSIPDTNYWHYALQLNTYKSILERKYGKEIVSLHLVRLHPDADGYELIDLPILEDAVIALYEERLSKI